MAEIGFERLPCLTQNGGDRQSAPWAVDILISPYSPNTRREDIREGIAQLTRGDRRNFRLEGPGNRTQAQEANDD
jgi:hypothetical protein